MKVKLHGFHHKEIILDLNEVEGWYYPVYWNRGYWWTVKMKDGTEHQIYVRGKVEALEEQCLPTQQK
jgi:hypothetical protein